MDWLTQTPIAHRGLHSEGIPENTTAAFRAAIDEGYPIELDVHLTKDGVPIVFHDREFEWPDESTDPIRNILYTDIRQYQSPDGGYSVPRLHVALDVIDGQVPILVDVKNPSRDIGPLESVIVERLDRYEGEFAVQSFNPMTLGYFRKHRPDWPRGQLAEHFTDVEGLTWWQKAALKRLVMTWWSQPDFIGYRHSDLPYWPVRLHRRMGIPILAWTVRTARELHEAHPYSDNVIFEHIRP